MSDASPIIENDGYCPYCEAPARFAAWNAWLRDYYICTTCRTIPRERALLVILAQRFPDWRRLRIHEAGPSGRTLLKFRRECPGYIASHWFSDVPSGAMRNGFRSEDLERQTFADQSFDIVITQDVMEHVLDPWTAFREIARTLAPGGAHVFTTPINKGMADSKICARAGADGAIEHLAPPEYHGNPIDPNGSLVTMLWGQDIGELIVRHAGMPTTIYCTIDRDRGLLGEYLEVLVSRRA